MGMGVDVDTSTRRDRLGPDHVGVDERTDHSPLSERQETLHLATADRPEARIDSEFDGAAHVIGICTTCRRVALPTPISA